MRDLLSRTFATLILGCIGLLISGCAPEGLGGKSRLVDLSTSLKTSDPDAKGPGTGGGDGAPRQERVNFYQNIQSAQDRITNFMRPESAYSLRTILYGSGALDPSGGPQGAKAEDSALFTGVYLGSQCLRYQEESKVGNFAQSMSALAEIEKAIGAIEVLHEITGVPGLLARFVHHSSATYPMPSCGLKQIESGSGKYKDYKWCGLTSRDQTQGVFFGLGVCQASLPESERDLRGRLAELASTIAIEIAKNQWVIPYGDYIRKWGDFNARAINGKIRLSLATVALRALEDISISQSDPRQDYRLDLEREVLNAHKGFSNQRFLENPWYSEFVEYYALHLSTLALVSSYLSETDAGRKQSIADFFHQALWGEIWSHRNPLFVFSKQLMNSGRLAKSTDPTIGIELSSPVAMENFAKQSAREEVMFAVTVPRTSRRERVDYKRYCTPGRKHAGFKVFFDGLKDAFAGELLGKFLGTKLPPELCEHPLPILMRGGGEYYWQENPFNPTLSLHSDLYIGNYSGVDTLIAYWLGRASGQIGASE